MRHAYLTSLALVLALACCSLLLADDLNDRRQELAIKDSMDWAAGIIQGLGTLAAPPSAVAMPVRPSAASQSVARRPKARAEAVPVGAPPTIVPTNETKQFEYKQKGRYTEVVIQIKDKIENGSSKNFRLTVTSTQPLTGWTVRLRGSDTVLAQGGLFGETSFSKLVPQPYRPDFVMNLSVQRDGQDWVDFFKLYNEGTVQSQ